MRRLSCAVEGSVAATENPREVSIVLTPYRSRIGHDHVRLDGRRRRVYVKSAANQIHPLVSKGEIRYQSLRNTY